MTLPTRFALFLVAFGTAGAVFAGPWDRFRGPNGTGAVDDKNVPLKFGEKEHRLWKVAIPGAGHSSPVVWGTHLFVQTADPAGKDRTLLCIDTADGKTRWEKTIPGVRAPIHNYSSFASSTPATDGEAVYVSFWDGKGIVVAAYDFQGKPLWSKDLGPFFSQHGAGASPILYKDKLILADDMDAYVESKGKGKAKTPVPVKHPSLLVALDKKTGDVVWDAPRPAVRACYSAPFLLQRPGESGPELIVVSTPVITAYNPDSGSKLWEATDWQAKSVRMPLRTVASSVVSGDVLLACAGDGAGDRLSVGIALPVPGKSDAPQRLWDNRKDFPYVPCPLVRGEYFYFVNDSGYAGCYHAKSGKRVWYERLEDGRFSASPLLIDGKVYAFGESGEAYVFAAEPTYRLLAQNTVGEAVRASPAAADGRLYVRGARHLFCYGKTK